MKLRVARFSRRRLEFSHHFLRSYTQSPCAWIASAWYTIGLNINAPEKAPSAKGGVATQRISSIQRAASAAWGVALLFIGWAFCLYPAAATVRAVWSSELRNAGQPPSLLADFEATASRYRSWAKGYLESRRAASVASNDVPSTEWPMFGSVFLLVTADDLYRGQKLSMSESTRQALQLAAEVVADPATSTWVQAKWGLSYLERENVFYRMLLIMGLGSYEALTRDQQYGGTLQAQTVSLTRELLAAPLHLADDYPGECYPSDVLWAVAAIKRASTLGYGSREDVDELARGVLAVLNGPALTRQGLPGFRVNASTGRPMQPARGAGNSGILIMAAELDHRNAAEWFNRYAAQYWEEGWVSGFRESPPEENIDADADSGPVLFGVGTVATGLGIGAARSVGRFDYAVPIAMETVPASWPTPFGMLLPGALGWAAADGWCFGELMLLFSMTRPNMVGHVVPYRGGVPIMVWVFLLIFLAGAACSGWQGWRSLRKGYLGRGIKSARGNWWRYSSTLS